MIDTKNIPTRAAGVLLPVSSLPSQHGIGTFGQAAYRWVDFLQSAGQQYWQVLPLGPTSFGDSPYQSFSAFAGNPYFIDFTILQKEGLLTNTEYENISWGKQEDSIDYETIFQYRESILRIAFANFKNWNELQIFAKENEFWLENYALYMAIKSAQGQTSWLEWPQNLKMYEPATIANAKKEFAQDIQYHIFVQYQFAKQWQALRQYANQKGVQIIGDIPIYVSLDSADVWQNQSLFQLDENAMPIAVAGVPPDYFSANGQLWGNPLYNWHSMEKDKYHWWIQRIKATFNWYDILRIDHFRGLESYYSIPFPAENAKKGKWKKGPGMALINALTKGVPQARFIAEDLGFLTDDVRKLLAKSTFPGMKVLQFAFDTKEANDYTPYTYEENTVVYTGTHDNDTILGWARSASTESVRRAMDYIGAENEQQLRKGMIRLAFQTKSKLAIIPMQDWLSLGKSARLNTPSTIGGSNWRWRMRNSQLTNSLCQEMQSFTTLYGRHPKTKKTAKETLSSAKK